MFAAHPYHLLHQSKLVILCETRWSGATCGSILRCNLWHHKVDSSAGDWVKSKLSSQELTTVTWHGHVTKALRLLGMLCDMASTLPTLNNAVAVSPILWPPCLIALSFERRSLDR